MYAVGDADVYERERGREIERERERREGERERKEEERERERDRERDIRNNIHMEVQAALVESVHYFGNDCAHTLSLSHTPPSSSSSIIQSFNHSINQSTQACSLMENLLK